VENSTRKEVGSPEGNLLGSSLGTSVGYPVELFLKTCPVKRLKITIIY